MALQQMTNLRRAFVVDKQERRTRSRWKKMFVSVAAHLQYLAWVSIHWIRVVTRLHDVVRE